MTTRIVFITGSVGLAQAHPLSKTPAMRKQPSAGLDPVTVHPPHSGVGPRTLSYVARNSYIYIFFSFKHVSCEFDKCIPDVRTACNGGTPLGTYDICA